MKPITFALLIVPLLLSASTTRVSREIDSQSQMSFSRTAQLASSPPGRSPASYPSRSLRGGFHPHLTVNFWDGYSDIPARSLWGGFPLNTDMAVTTTQSSSAQPSLVTYSLPSSCEAPDDFCITQHRFLFQRPFSPFFNTFVDPSYPYGSTQFGALAPHHGVEIENPTGTPILAVEDGIVVVAGDDAHSVYGPWRNFYGNLVVLEHHLPGMEEPVYTLYGHLSTIKVRVEQMVKVGEPIGEVGTTGRATGSHLHFEVRVGANLYTNTRNPALWLLPHDEKIQQDGVLAGKLDNAQGDPIHFTIKAEYYPDIHGAPDNTFYIETYATDIDPIGKNETYQENFVLPDLPPGWYRIALNASGKWTERWVEVEPGKLSFVTIVSR
jgi:murein DD-endopeptidase MepM/ murein hydrolase activator NlpD